jgi:hypothetical protein
VRGDGKRRAKPAKGVSTGFGAAGSASDADKPKPITSFCETYRDATELGLSRGRSAMAIWQDMVSDSESRGSYQTVKRFVRKLRRSQPPQAAYGDLHRPARRGLGRLRQGPYDPQTRAENIVALDCCNDAELQSQSGTLPDLRSISRISAELHEKAFRLFGAARARSCWTTCVKACSFPTSTILL